MRQNTWIQRNKIKKGGERWSSSITLYDSNMGNHHHAIDEVTGEIVDIDLDEKLEQGTPEGFRGEDWL